MSVLSIREGTRAGDAGFSQDTLTPGISRKIRAARPGLWAARWLLSSVILLVLSLTGIARSQDLELHGGWAHVTSDGGLDGFNAGIAYHFNQRIAVGFDYDQTWDRSTPTIFVASSLGAIIVRSHLENYLIGPRIYFPTKKLTFKKQKLIPFGEFEFGASRLSTTVDQVGLPSQHNAGEQYSWLLGGGADHHFNTHWAGRINADLLRTHFASSGQSRFRFGLGIVYLFSGK